MKDIGLQDFGDIISMIDSIIMDKGQRLEQPLSEIPLSALQMPAIINIS